MAVDRALIAVYINIDIDKNRKEGACDAIN